MRFIAFAALMFLLIKCEASAQVLETTNRTLWQNSGGSYTTLNFTDLPNFTIVTTQYSTQGITFTDGNDHVHAVSGYSDGHGLVSSDGFGNIGTIHASFAQPMRWLGFDFIGALRVTLYSDGAPFYVGTFHHADFGPFLGFVSTQPFDAFVADNPAGNVIAIDNIHFGPPIPGPGAPALMLAALLAGRPHRRRSDD